LYIASKKPFGIKAESVLFVDDDMILKVDVKHVCRLLDFLCQLNVTVAWAQISRRVVVAQKQTGGTDRDGRLDDVADIDSGGG
jgi:hypothetical protein